MAIRIGTNPIGWSNDDMPELGGETPLETCLAEAREAGFSGIELGNKFPRDPDALRPILARHRLDLVSGWYSANLLERTAEEEIAAMEPHLRLLRAMGSPVMVFCETARAVHGSRGVPVDTRPVLADADWALLAPRIATVARHMAESGVRMAYHHHMGTVIQTAAEVDRLMAMTGPEVGLLLDTGHLTFSGDDPAAVARRHAARITHVHCKDVRADVLARARGERWSFLDSVVAGVYTVPGDGCVDFPAALRPVAQAGYAGWLVVEAEQDPAKAHPLTYARMGHRNLVRLASEAGFGAIEGDRA
ncbi:myo-inosose-2 dehydratase [Arenibaculum pallidiluteum]|uniref:myo-inosose-2 dehydratase n=1 Tax=Arenibaculum pallidiluteum TaxID=2812559 RepID=UPI001A975A4B|nr:myo-inosose-2 dehydratase [Arenibaculum pallidiluteum]